MEYGKVYIKWIKYLKERRLYAKYRRDYSIAIDIANERQRAMLDGSYWRPDYKPQISKAEKILNGEDFILRRKNDHNFDYYDLRIGMYMLLTRIRDSGITPGIDWFCIAEEFGVEEGFCKRQPPAFKNSFLEVVECDSNLWDSASTINRSRREEAHAGQWYDRFYDRGRNVNNRNNIRWRR